MVEWLNCVSGVLLSTTYKKILLTYLCTAGFCLQPLVSVHANPEGGTVTAGDVDISSSGSRLDIFQKTDKAIIDWRKFDINSSETTQFFQPNSSSVILNRVNASDPSQINGNLLANGHVIIVNPNGVFFGAGSRVDVGSLTATTADIDNSDFMNGILNFDKAGHDTAIIRNDGTITAQDAGLVSLVGPEVINNGIISARLGRVNLSSGETFTLDLAGDGVTKLSVQKSQMAGKVINNGHIQADGGTVVLTAAAAKDIVDSLVSNTGIIEARSLGTKNGKVILSAEGTHARTSTTTATTGLSKTLNSGRISVDGIDTYETGGAIEITGDLVGITDQALLSANGYAGGGTILIGGDAHGAGDTARSTMTVIQSGVLITANALSSGNGGKVIVWSDDTTNFLGSIEAAARHNNHGTGGFVETSGKSILNAYGLVDATSLNGQAGEWLLDPFNVTISSAANSNISNSGGDPNIFTPTANATLSVSSIQASLNAGTSVIVNTNVPGGGSGDITVNNSIVKSSGGNAYLTLSAYRNITFAAGVGISSTSGTLDVTLNADNTGLQTGYVSLGNGTINTNGGNIIIGGGLNPLTTAAFGNGGSVYGVYLNGTTLNAAGGDISITGQGRATGNSNFGVYLNTASNVLTTGTGTITINGTGGGGANGSSNYGVHVAGGSRITTADGDITVTGTGGGAGTGTNNHGILVNAANSSIRSTGSGSITLTGTGGNTTGSGASNYGISINTVDGVLTNSGNIYMVGLGGGFSGATNYGVNIVGSATSTSGDISVTGTGGNSSGISNRGIVITGATAALTTGSNGTITLTGTGSGNTNSSSNHGIEVSAGGKVTSADGDITVAGTGGGAGTGASNYGIHITGTNSSIKTTGAGSITATGNGGNTTGSGATNIGVNMAAANSIQAAGTGNIIVNGTGGGNSSATNYGVNLSTANASMTANGGNITVTGQGGNASGNSNVGIRLAAAGATISTTGSGQISMTGTGGGNTNSASNYGIEISTGSILSAADGNLTVVATGGGAGTGTNNHGIYITGTGSTLKTTGSGLISVTGNGGNSTGSGGTNVGVYINNVNGINSLGTGNISVTGTGGLGTAGSNHGVYIAGSMISASGNISVTGTGGNSTGNSNRGVVVSGANAAISASGSGTLTVSGTGSGQTNSGSDYGVEVSTGGKILVADGNMSITGTSGGSGSGNNNYGILVNNANSTIKSTGAGSITVTGTGGNNSGTGNTNIGVHVNIANGITSTGTGTISVNGTGGNSSGGINYGVYVPGSITSSASNISVTGTGGNSTGNTNIGVYLNGAGAAIAASGSGNVAVTGTGGGSSATSNSNRGVYLNSTSSISAVNGNVTVTGTGGGGASGSSNYGVHVASGNSIATSGSGNVNVTGISGNGTTPYGVILAGANGLRTTGTGNIAISTNTISLNTANNINSAANLAINPYTNGATMGIGSGAGILTLSNAFLGFLTWGNTLTLGNSQTGDMTINTSTVFNKSVVFRTGSTGDVRLNGTLNSTIASGTAFTLASGKNFVNNVGAGAINPGSGRWLVYSTSPSSDTINGLANNFRRFSCAYGGSCPVVPATGNGFLYSTTPLLTITPDTMNITYGDAPSLNGYGYTVTGYLGGDAAADSLSGSLIGTTNYVQGDDVGSYAINYSSGALASDMGYGFIYGNNATALDVGQKTLTVTLSGYNRVYDGTNATSLTSGTATLNGIYGTDAIALNNVAGTFDTKNVGTNKLVSFSGLSLSGAKASNYVLASTSASANVGTITKATLNITGVTALDKVYDGTTRVALNKQSAALSGLFGSDSVLLNSSQGIGNFYDLNLGFNKSLSTSGFSISGADAGNYNLVQPQGLTADLTAFSNSQFIPDSLSREIGSLSYDIHPVERRDGIPLSEYSLYDERTNTAIYQIDPLIQFAPEILDEYGLSSGQSANKHKKINF